MSYSLRVLVACECSQIVTSAFLSLGHDAYSCDIQECCGPYPSRHLQKDVLEVLDSGWDLIIAHPPCTYLSHAGENWFHLVKCSDSYSRWNLRLEAARFFLRLYNCCNCSHVCVENPVGFMNNPSVFRSPDQIIQPYQFGDKVKKRTCFWLRGLPPLFPTFTVKPDVIRFPSGRVCGSWLIKTLRLSSLDRRNARSVFFPGVARAMALQWSDYLLHDIYGLPRYFPGMQSEFDFS